MNIENSPGAIGRFVLAVVILAALVVALVGSGLAGAAVGPTDLALTKGDSADPAVQGTVDPRSCRASWSPWGLL